MAVDLQPGCSLGHWAATSGSYLPSFQPQCSYSFKCFQDTTGCNFKAKVFPFSVALLYSFTRKISLVFITSDLMNARFRPTAVLTFLVSASYCAVLVGQRRVAVSQFAGKRQMAALLCMSAWCINQIPLERSVSPDSIISFISTRYFCFGHPIPEELSARTSVKQLQ